MRLGWILDSYLSLAGNFPCVTMIVDHKLTDEEYSWAKLYAYGRYQCSNVGIVVQS